HCHSCHVVLNSAPAIIVRSLPIFVNRVPSSRTPIWWHSSTAMRSTTRTPKKKASRKSSSRNSATVPSATSNSFSETTSQSFSTTNRARTSSRNDTGDLMRERVIVSQPEILVYSNAQGEIVLEQGAEMNSI